MIDILRTYGPSFLSGTWLTIELVVISAAQSPLFGSRTSLTLAQLGIVTLVLVHDRIDNLIEERTVDAKQLAEGSHTGTIRVQQQGEIV